MSLLLAILLALTNSLLFGFSKVLYRKGLTNLPLGLAIFYTLLPAPPLLLSAALLLDEWEWVFITPTTLVIIALSGLFNFNLGRLFLFESIKSIGAARASQLIATQLIFASLLGVLLLGEEMSLTIALGTLIIFGAITLLLLAGPADARLRPLGYKPKRGLVMGLGGGITWGLAFIISKLLLSNYPPLSAALLTMIAALLFQALALVKTLARNAFNTYPRDRGSITYLLVSGVMTTGAFLAFMAALRLAPVVVVAPFATLSPIFAAIGSYLFIQRLEYVGLRVLTVSALVALGSYLIAYA